MEDTLIGTIRTGIGDTCDGEGVGDGINVG